MAKAQMKELTSNLWELKVGGKRDFIYKSKETFKSKKKGWKDSEMWTCIDASNGDAFKMFANRQMKDAGAIFGYKAGTKLRITIEKGKGKYKNVRLWAL